jgi:hypothetical protein
LWTRRQHGLNAFATQAFRATFCASVEGYGAKVRGKKLHRHTLEVRGMIRLAGRLLARLLPLRRRGRGNFAAFLWLFAVLTSFSPATAAPSIESTLKAQYLFKLPPFVDWPTGAIASPDDPFRLCVVGDDPFGVLLDVTGKGQSAANHPVALVHLKSASPDDHCQMMYVSGDAQFVAQSLAAVSGTPVLTVTDAQNGEKGIVNFTTVQNHVRIEIDQQAALKNHLNISSKLLGIAASPEEKIP